MQGTLERASPALAAAFGGLDPPVLARLQELALRRSLIRGQFVFRNGDLASHLFVTESGSVKLAALAPDGRETLISVLGPGETFGEVTATQQVHDARANETGAVLALPLVLVRDVLGGERAGDLVIAMLSERLRRTTVTLHGLMRGDVRARVAARLCELAEHHGAAGTTGIRLRVRVTQEDLAHMTGTSRESVNKVLSYFARQHLIAKTGGRYVIKDLWALREFAGV